MKYPILGTLLVFIPIAALGQTRTIPFPEIWDQVKVHSPEIQGADHELKAAKAAETMAGNHWFPRVYAQAQGFATDDPAISFMSLLEQRAIAAPDLSTASLDQPLDKLYGRGTLGIDLPLFEGGGKEALAGSARKAREAKEWEKEGAQAGQYAKTAGDYASLLVLMEERRDLDLLKEKVLGILAHYGIGSRSNPVGYSGSLGLKTLDNRLTGLLAQNLAQWNSFKDRIETQCATLSGKWTPASERAQDFLQKVFTGTNKAQDPAYVRAAQAGADALEKAKGAQSARLLPTVGLLGEGYLNTGDRATATGYMAGAYLRWDLLDVPNFGAEEEASEAAQAARSRSEALQRQARSQVVQARESLTALSANLDLMDQSSKFLDEQTDTAKTLFKNGSINALQLVEVLSRRADLIASRSQAQMGLVQAQVTLALHSAFQEPVQ